jgi:hypothetical protein
MAYDKGLAQVVRETMEQMDGFDEKKMFGGLCFLLHGNMACGVLNNDLIVRVGAENYENCLKDPLTRKFDITGRPMKGWVMLPVDDLISEEDIIDWVRKGVDFSLSLPPK